MHIKQLDSSHATIYRTLRIQAVSEFPPAFGSLVDEEKEKPLEEIEQYLTGTDDRVLFGAFMDSTLVGVIRHSAYSGANEGHRSYVAGFYVDPSHRGKGIGRALLEEAIALAEKMKSIIRINLTVVSGQVAAIQLYESIGFTKCGTDYETFTLNGKFYDEILMTKSLKIN